MRKLEGLKGGEGKRRRRVFEKREEEREVGGGRAAQYDAAAFLLDSAGGGERMEDEGEVKLARTIRLQGRGKEMYIKIRR